MADPKMSKNIQCQCVIIQFHRKLQNNPISNRRNNIANPPNKTSVAAMVRIVNEMRLVVLQTILVVQ